MKRHASEVDWRERAYPAVGGSWPRVDIVRQASSRWLAPQSASSRCFRPAEMRQKFSFIHDKLSFSPLETVKVGAYLDSFDHSLLLGYGEVLLGYSLLESVNSSPRGVQIRRFRHQIVLHSWKLNLRVFINRISDRIPFDIFGLPTFLCIFFNSPEICAS